MLKQPRSVSRLCPIGKTNGVAVSPSLELDTGKRQFLSMVPLSFSEARVIFLSILMGRYVSSIALMCAAVPANLHCRQHGMEN